MSEMEKTLKERVAYLEKLVNAQQGIIKTLVNISDEQHKFNSQVANILKEDNEVLKFLLEKGEPKKKMNRYCLAKKCVWAIKSGDKKYHCLFGECPYGYSFQFIKGKKIMDKPKNSIEHSENYKDLCSLVGLKA